MNKNVCSPENRTEDPAPPAARPPSQVWELCVVCGRNVEPGRQAARINHRGNTVNLCGPQCLRMFADEPDPYLARLAKTMRERALRNEPACS